VVEQLLGPAEYLRAGATAVVAAAGSRPNITAQIALRFPELAPDCVLGDGAPALDQCGAVYHLDGACD
jgi:hypothetical protein